MSVLHISPDSHVLVHAAAAAVLYLHIGAGTLASALFLGQPQVFPKALQGWLFLPALLILGLLLYWLGHVGYGALRRRARSQVLAAPPP